jgi:hypothetical protein
MKAKLIDRFCDDVPAIIAYPAARDLRFRRDRVLHRHIVCAALRSAPLVSTPFWIADDEPLRPHAAPLSRLAD